MNNPKQSAFKQRALVFFGFLFVSFFFSRKILLHPGIIGLRDDWLMVPFPAQHVFSTTRFLYSWFNGGVLYRSLGEIPGIILGTLSAIFNLNGEFYSKFFVLFFPALAGFNLYQLGLKLNLKSWAAFISGIVYITSPFFFNSVVSGYILFLIVFSLLPLAIHLYLNILESSQLRLFRIVELAVIVRITFTQDNAVYITGIIMGLLFFYFIIINRTKISFLEVLKKTFLIFFFVLIFTAQFWILIPLNLKESIAFVTSGLDTWITDLSPKIIPAIFQDGGGYKYFLNSIPKEVYYLWTVNSSLFLAMVALSMFYIRRNRNLGYFALLFIVGTLGFKGGNYPFGELNKFLLKYFPVVMGGFRNTQYFTAISSIGLSICFGIFLTYFVSLVKSRHLSLFFTIITIMVLFRGLPFFSGDYGKNVQNVVLNPDLNDLDSALRSIKDRNTVLMLPPIVPVKYQNSNFAGLDIMAHGQPRRFIGIAGDSPFQRQLIESLYLSDNQNLFRWFLSIYNVKHIAWRDDFKSVTISFMSPDYIPYWPVWTNQRLFNNVLSLPEVSLVKSFSQQTSLYQYSQPSPTIFAPNQITVLPDNPLKPLEYANKVPQNILGATLFVSQNMRDITGKLSTLNLATPPVIDFQYQNPTRYRLSVQEANSPFVIVFSENFNSMWQIISTQNRHSLTLPHFVVNGYANGWIVDPQELCQKIKCKSSPNGQSFSLDIDFLAQKYYLVGIILSYGGLFVAVLALLFEKSIIGNKNQV